MFVALVLFTILVESVLHHLESHLLEDGERLFAIVYNEIMILGLISLALFFVQDARILQGEAEAGLGVFHFLHVAVFLIAIMYVAMASLWRAIKNLSHVRRARSLYAVTMVEVEPAEAAARRRPVSSRGRRNRSFISWSASWPRTRRGAESTVPGAAVEPAPAPAPRFTGAASSRTTRCAPRSCCSAWRTRSSRSSSRAASICALPPKAPSPGGAARGAHRPHLLGQRLRGLRRHRHGASSPPRATGCRTARLSERPRTHRAPGAGALGHRGCSPAATRRTTTAALPSRTAT